MIKIASTICFVLAALTLYVAVTNIAKGPPHNPNMTAEVQRAQVVGYIIGSLLFPFIFGLAGMFLRVMAARKDEPIVASVVDNLPQNPLD
jgi:hypothetical protein